MWFETVHGPRVFAWNWTKHIRLPRWGFDFDGVLCRDNTKAANDAGPRYAEFLANAEPLFIPQRAIGPIITGRAEKYHAAPDAWLPRHGIQLDTLQITPCATNANRRAPMGCPGARGD